MKNTLKYVLIITGLFLVIFGLYELFTPKVLLQVGPIKVEAEENNTQPWAMIGLGVLSLLGGIAFKKR